MRVSVELPDPPRLEPLLQALSQQYSDVLSRLLALTERVNAQDRVSPVVDALASQRDELVRAFGQLFLAMRQSQQEQASGMTRVLRDEVLPSQSAASDALLSAIKGMKRSLAGMPDQLGSVMDEHFKARQQRLMARSTPPPRGADASAVVKKLDTMEHTLAQAMAKSRNRTFGSNY